MVSLYDKPARNQHSFAWPPWTMALTWREEEEAEDEEEEKAKESVCLCVSSGHGERDEWSRGGERRRDGWMDGWTESRTWLDRYDKWETRAGLYLFFSLSRFPTVRRTNTNSVNYLAHIAAYVPQWDRKACECVCERMYTKQDDDSLCMWRRHG